MALSFLFPDVGEGIHEARIVEWLVAEGDVVTEDQPLLKVETDKAVVEIPSPKAGPILRISVAQDAVIHVGDELVLIGAEGESLGTQTPAAKPVTPAVPLVEEAPKQEAATPKTTARRPLATPKTRALARKLGVDLSGISGSGAGGRISDEDVRRASAGEYSAAGSVPAPKAPITSFEPGSVERVPISHLRKIIAGAMRSSTQISAHVTHVDEADVTPLLEVYRSIKAGIEASEDMKFSLLPFFIKALVQVLKDFPIFNASVDEEAGEILIKHFYNIGIAVDTPEGLIVPVIRDADRKNMVELAAEISDLAQRARSRSLNLDEIRGGSCTITNIGPLGGVFATPIINQPELAIIGLHTIKKRPVVIDDEIVIRQMMYLSISFDHRWIDGAEAARFMSAFVRLVSSPSLLLARL